MTTVLASSLLSYQRHAALLLSGGTTMMSLANDKLKQQASGPTPHGSRPTLSAHKTGTWAIMDAWLGLRNVSRRSNRAAALRAKEALWGDQAILYLSPGNCVYHYTLTYMYGNPTDYSVCG